MDFIDELLVDLCFIGGIIIFIISFFKKYREYRYAMMLIGVLLVFIGLIFLDTGSLQEVYQKGYEAAQGI
ncbi:hypothetical protein [Fodinibius sp. SL11]|uniref:hypothetical protein n=1 Tax=Fodinibius sp. SL11 TaxID=3425690 RepID=UPI003F88335E